MRIALHAHQLGLFPDVWQARDVPAPPPEARFPRNSAAFATWHAPCCCFCDTAMGGGDDGQGDGTCSTTIASFGPPPRRSARSSSPASPSAPRSLRSRPAARHRPIMRRPRAGRRMADPGGHDESGGGLAPITPMPPLPPFPRPNLLAPLAPCRQEEAGSPRISISMQELLPMGIFSRTRDIIAANVTDLLDKAEDPAKMIRMIIMEMEETLVEVRASAARTIADQKEIRRQVSKLETVQANWLEKAELALSKDREDLAKAALTEKQKAAD